MLSPQHQKRQIDTDKWDRRYYSLNTWELIKKGCQPTTTHQNIKNDSGMSFSPGSGVCLIRMCNKMCYSMQSSQHRGRSVLQ